LELRTAQRRESAVAMPDEMWTQERLPLASEAVRDLVIISTAWGTASVDAAWWDRYIVCNANWREHWLALLDRLAEHRVRRPDLYACGDDRDAEPFD